MVQRVYTSIGADPQTLDKIKNCTATEDNMTEFIGLLEQKGIALVEEYSYLLAEVCLRSWIIIKFNSKSRLREEMLRKMLT